MKNYIKKTIILIFICILGKQFSHAASKQKFIPFPADTVQRFIKLYGKDSLLHLLDNKIKLTGNYLNINNNNKSGTMVSFYELVLLNKHFNLALDSNLIYLPQPTNNQFYRLYDIFLGDSVSMKKTISDMQVKMSPNELKKQFEDNISNTNCRVALSTFCENYTLPVLLNKAIDTLFGYRMNLQSSERLHNFWVLIETSKNCGKSYDALNVYIDNYYKELDKSYNFQKILSDSTVGSLIHPIQKLAYSLYGNKINLNTQSDNLMYLLSLQNSDYGWSMYTNYSDKSSNMETTIYGLWALCEFRQKLREM